MATYILPQVRVFQDVALAAVDTQPDLSAFLAGPAAALYRYASDKSQILLGMYDHVGTSIDGDFKTCYSWPGRPAGALVDSSYTKVFIDDALLRYYLNEASELEKTASNKVRHPGVSFADNPLLPATYPKSAALLDRGAKVGDVVRVLASDGLVDHELITYIRALEGDTVAASVGAAASASGNQATVSQSESISAAAGNTGATTPTADGSAYSGFVDGDVTETYTITVIQGATGGDHTTARLRITSASGNDDVASKTPSASGVATAIGARGATATFTGGTLALGDVFTLTVQEEWFAPAAVSGGTYTGSKDRTYRIEVTTGGDSSGDDPVITAVATDGSDFSTTSVSGEWTAVPVGSYGVTVYFTQEETAATTTTTTTEAPGGDLKLRQGDVYTITATAAKEGQMRTIVLGHNLHEDIPLSDAATADIRLALYIKSDIQVPENHVSVGGQVNWEQSATELCLFSDVYAFHSEWTDDGEPVALPVITEASALGTNQAYVEYRAWRSDVAASAPESLSDVADLDDAVPGELHPDNTLKWALFKALSNSDGEPVRYMGVPDPASSSDWSNVLEAIKDRLDVYNLVPLTYDRTILDLFHAHVTNQSNELANRWRTLWVGLTVDASVEVVSESTSSDGEAVLATTADDPSTSGTQYTLLEITSGNAELVSLGVAAGDVVRFQYTSNAWGEVSYSEYTVDAVLSEDSLRLVGGTAAAESVPRKVEIWHPRSKAEQAAAIATAAGAWGDKRVRAVWPDKVSSGGLEFDNIHLCAALAALSAAVLPHQGLTNVELAGFDNVDRAAKFFGGSHLDTMAESGVWIVTQDVRTGTIHTRHALTTGDQANLAEKEEMVVRNLDSISFRFYAAYAPYIGKANAVPSILEKLGTETRAVIQDLRSSGFTQMLGGQLVDGEVTELRISPVFRDRVIVGLNLTLPFPLNEIHVHLIV